MAGEDTRRQRETSAARDDDRAKVLRVEAGPLPADPNAAPQKSAGHLSRVRIQRTVRDIRDGWEIRSDPKYRRLAKSYELPDGSSRVYCYHIRKTAGTSLFLSFMALGGEDPTDVWRRITTSRLSRTVSGRFGYVSNSRRLLAEGSYFYGRSHRAAALQPLPPKTFTVTILRDPIDRVRSYFDYLATGDAPDTPGRVAERERRMAADGFDAFLDRVPVDSLLNQLSMFSEQLDVSEAADRIAGCSGVLLTEDFSDGLAGLARRLGLPLEIHRARAADSPSLLTGGQKERLRLRLEPEYELLRRLSEGGIVGMGSTQPA